MSEGEIGLPRQTESEQKANPWLEVKATIYPANKKGAIRARLFVPENPTGKAALLFKPGEVGYNQVRALSAIGQDGTNQVTGEVTSKERSKGEELREITFEGLDTQPPIILKTGHFFEALSELKEVSETGLIKATYKRVKAHDILSSRAPQTRLPIHKVTGPTISTAMESNRRRF